ncbi:GNAT family N-acetyltransferase [Salinivibrio socompensis]|uniref:GNAT family N-acetyltransferase n=1 Tax=Salinivibrio socompensis TaxID=1510206 RepID=UPI00046E6144|nr:GNAT family N-acetyltransferase [Salinivibrio socompensis]
MQLLVRPLTRHDRQALLAFEQANRTYFETFVNSRGDAFYSLEGVAEHIESLLALNAQNEHIPMLITNATQAIIGRVNISQIDAASGSGSLGYRIAENQTGKGVASRAVKYALEVAREHGLQSLNAMVSTTNDASQKVLSRNGFLVCGMAPQWTSVGGQVIDCIHYKADIVSPRVR